MKKEDKKPAAKAGGFDPFFDMMEGESSDEMDLMDFDNFKAAPKKKEAEVKKEDSSAENV